MRLKKYYLLLVVPMLFAACQKENQECPGSVEKDITRSNFSSVAAGETFGVEIIKGNTCTIKASGCSNDLNDLEVSVSADDILSIQYNHYKSNRYRVDFVITMPILISVNAGGTAKVNVSGFELQPTTLNVTAGGAAECDINGAPQYMTFTIGGTAELGITSTAQISSLIGSTGGTSRISAYQAPAKKIYVQAAGTSKIYVSPVDELKAGASGDSRIYYKGAPVNIETQQTGTGKVIREF